MTIIFELGARSAVYLSFSVPHIVILCLYTCFNFTNQKHSRILINFEERQSFHKCSCYFMFNYISNKFLVMKKTTQWKFQKQEKWKKVSISLESNKCATWIMVL